MDTNHVTNFLKIDRMVSFSRHRTVLIAATIFLCFFSQPRCIHAFVSKVSSISTVFSNQNHNRSCNVSFKSRLHANRSPAEFELQELRAQFTAMLNQKVRPKMLTDDKRSEIESYLSNVLQMPSPTPLKSLGDNNASKLHGCWTMVFSTGGNNDDVDALGNLPRDCTVQLKMEPNYRADYKLSFSKTFGLESLTAKSSYIVDTSLINPGLVTFIYQEIVSDVFGFKALPIGLFGMLKGRTTYVDTVWFDGNLWIERGYNLDGQEFYNVYIKSAIED
mmetsp:Transcript_18799/g.28579  ORF Transcript_18799/g.28579 Transcript_18799/m.28579 type:complete len:276 (-) Transcript_18799:133-960(-)